MKKYLTILLVLLHCAVARGASGSQIDFDNFFQNLKDSDVVFPFTSFFLEDNSDPDGEPFVEKSKKYHKDKSDLVISLMKGVYNESVQLKAKKVIEKKSNGSIELSFSGPDNGYAIIFSFVKTKGKWMLAKFEDRST